MNYQIKTFAELTGVSERTLRYYHEHGLLVPAVASNGYRTYSSQDADRLQLILMYRQLQFSLAEIQQLLVLPPAERLERLANQREQLVKQQAALTATLAQLDATLQNQTGGIQMTDQTKFEQFKQQAVAENEQRYGQEVTTNYGKQAKQEADQHFLGLSEAQYATMQAAEARLKTALQTYLDQPQLPSEAAQTAFEAHQTWLQTATPRYSLAMHRGLVAMYVADERFTAYYTKLIGDQRAAEALQTIIEYYAIEA
ncbi:MerR family transcriptional regulator [Latilactobacillus curvatus]|uniref:MerR family transcriptional regulator n=1 Tax=Latilactobacillus curvatus TaxID=28038 RepID=UPI000F7CFCFA|nr:MerR family transcriptional regulator [Latilactobacillus curvatus]AZP95599.1 MerR family transcriptional regulator [Latilactobacillus curvatus]